VKGKENRPIIASKKSLYLYEKLVLEIKIMNHTGNHVKNINAIIDTGAQVSIIEQLVNELNWDVERTSLTISGIDGPDRKIKSAYACYGLITISPANPTIIQLFYIMPKMNAPILFASDFIKLMQIAIQPKPNGAYLLCQ